MRKMIRHLDDKKEKIKNKLSVYYNTKLKYVFALFQTIVSIWSLEVVYGRFILSIEEKKSTFKFKCDILVPVQHFEKII